MTILYRGDRPGNWWHVNNPKDSGFVPSSPGGWPSESRIIDHIAAGSVTSPYVSFTRSFSVARQYALVGKTGFASTSRPGYVWEIEVSADNVCKVIDPVIEIARTLPNPESSLSYQHDGSPGFLLGVVDPHHMGHYLKQLRSVPPGTGGTPRPANLSPQLEALVRTLRDAEILVQGAVPAALVRNRIEVIP